MRHVGRELEGQNGRVRPSQPRGVVKGLVGIRAASAGRPSEEGA